MCAGACEQLSTSASQQNAVRMPGRSVRTPGVRITSRSSWLLTPDLPPGPGFAARLTGTYFEGSVRLLQTATSCSTSSTALRRLPSCPELSPDVPFPTSNSSSCGPREEEQSIAQSGALGRRTGRPSGGWMLSVDATQTDDGSRAGKVSAVPSPALGAAQLLGDFCGHYSVGQPSVSLS